jgi:PhzF family phenazine biosynthesis protein
MRAGPPLHQVDAFAERAFTGNPAAVCLLDQVAEARWMQSVAAETNLPMTAFVSPRQEPDGYDLRWFTPATEARLCAHATLASAHVLWSTEAVASDAPIPFSTRAGLLTAMRDEPLVTLDLPARPVASAEAPAGLAEALGLDPAWTGSTDGDWIAEAERPEDVVRARPDPSLVAALPGEGVILTARGGAGGDDVTSRYFAPSDGLPEDPVTGSAHCALGPLWAERLGRPVLTCRQASSRGGILRVEPRGDRVRIAGHAVTVLEGRLRVAEAN